jgi:hypothetical protein
MLKQKFQALQSRLEKGPLSVLLSICLVLFSISIMAAVCYCLWVAFIHISNEGYQHYYPEGIAFGIFLLKDLYFWPSTMAEKRHHRNCSAIFMLNLLLGWSFVGWVIAMVWAFTDNRVTNTALSDSAMKAEYRKHVAETPKLSEIPDAIITLVVSIVIMSRLSIHNLTKCWYNGAMIFLSLIVIGALINCFVAWRPTSKV